MNRQDQENSVMKEADVCTSFEDMGIKDQVLRGLYEHGFSKPSAIQQRAILPIIKGRDVIAQAQSGTGESSMIAIAVNEMIDSWSLDTQVLILSPTRELALQTEKAIRSIGDFINIRVHACVGGNSLGYDISKLQNGVQVVSGTPGRVYDMLKRRELDTSSVRCLILDESDEILRRGFKVKINHIYRYLPLEVQVVLISATLPTEILEMTEKFMTDPVSILVKRDQLTSMESTELPRQAT